MRNLRGLIAARLWPALVTLLITAPVLAAEARHFVRGSWGEIRAAHSGRATVVHVWGPSCGPCLAELPEWAAFAREHPDLDLVLINGDRPNGRGAAAHERLEKAGLGGAESWAFADEHVDRLRFEIDPGWLGELPYTLLIGRDGGITTFSGSADFASLSTWLAEARLDGSDGRERR